jgi:hypothetical protein
VTNDSLETVELFADITTTTLQQPTISRGQLSPGAQTTVTATGLQSNASYTIAAEVRKTNFPTSPVVRDT